MFYGGIEGGGTKFVCGIGNEDGKIFERVSIPTTSPEDTILKVVSFFDKNKNLYKFNRIGVGCFGPLDLESGSDTFGYITSTPKKEWQFFNIKNTLYKALNTEIILDTDVNAAAIGEHFWGNGKGYNDLVYITVGTGIGGGIMSGGKLVHGLLHPEIGHILIGDENLLKGFKGICPYHVRCLEGLASGPAIEAFWGTDIKKLPHSHPAWEEESSIISQGLMNIILTVSPKRIILGGGVMNQKHLFAKIREKVVNLLNGYIQRDEICKSIDSYIVPTGLGENSGLLGAIALVIKN